MKTTPRYQEHIAAEIPTTIKGQDIKYRQLQLDKNSATYTSIASSNRNGQSVADLTCLKYTVETRGAPPADGYPLFLAMHGGGASLGDPSSNDEQWLYMKGFYRGSISQGIYIALRGIGNDWNLHFTAAAYTLIERLIENFVLFGNVNPDQVYLLGFSAGGDGVYRVAPRLAQRFAAVNAGGGHPGGAQFENLANVPICLQVGEYDNRFNRCYSVAEAATKIDTIKAKYSSNESIYLKDCFIHVPFDGQWFDLSDPLQDYGGRHWKWEEPNAILTESQYPGGYYAVVQDYQNWFTNYNNGSIPAQNFKYKDTNAISWMTSHRGNRPLPQRVVWDLRTGVDDSFGAAVFSNTVGRGSDGKGRSQNYWLDIAQYTSADVGERIEATIDKSSNTISVIAAQKYLRILLLPDMLANPLQKVTIKISNQLLTTMIKWDDASVIADTLYRNDPRFVFNGQIILRQGSSGGASWSVVTQTSSL